MAEMNNELEIESDYQEDQVNDDQQDEFGVLGEREVHTHFPAVNLTIYKDMLPPHMWDQPLQLHDLYQMQSSTSSSSSSSSSQRMNGKFRALFIIDSGFGSIKVCAAGAKKGIAFICSVKQANALFPQKEIASMMKSAPSGTWLQMKAVYEDEPIICAGYKYSSNKVLYFCWPPGAASCVEGEPYIAQFRDENGNPESRAVSRLSVFSRYFLHSNKIDIHNELRQGFLALEEEWVTTDCWFRLFTSIFGMTVTDCFLAYKAEIHQKHPDKDICIKEFANVMAAQFIAKGRESLAAQEGSQMEDDEVQFIPPAMEHRLAPYMKDPQKHHYLQRSCKICKAKSSYYCEQCGEDFPVCQEGTRRHDRRCLTEHRLSFSTERPQLPMSSPPPRAPRRTSDFSDDSSVISSLSSCSRRSV